MVMAERKEKATTDLTEEAPPLKKPTERERTALRHRWTGLALGAAESAGSSAEPSLDLKEREGGRTQRGHSDHNDSER